MNKFLNSPKALLIIFLLFFTIIPFFWLHPGEMDLGGDSNRLYFYDPLMYLNNLSLSIIVPDGMAGVDPTFYNIPFLLFLVVVKLFVGSSYLLITFFNILKLLGAFLTMYLLINELLKIVYGKKNNIKNINFIYSGLLSGLFYVLSPLTTGNWDKAIMSHNQIFLNPLMFLLLLKFFTTNNLKFIWFTLLISLVFAPNFGFPAAPALFAFYPLSLLFLTIFLKLTKSNRVSWKKIIIIFFIFFGLHAFHIIPQIVNLFEPGSFANTRVFDKQSIAYEGIRYFSSVLSLAKVSWSLLLPTESDIIKFAYSIALVVVVLVLFFIKKNKKPFLLTGVFFLITLYFFSANITNIGVEFYKNLFYIPGFSMFRNFIGQWAMVFAFFYALIFGQAFYILLNKLPKHFRGYFSFIIILLFIFSSWQFIKGNSINKIHSTSNNVKIPIKMDPEYEGTLRYIKNIPDEGKILILPFSDSFYQVVAGENGGAYIGSSTISYLADKASFAGYQLMTPSFSERFFSMSKEKDYVGISNLLKYLSVKYIFYNSDPRIYDKDFPASPYTYSRNSLPKSQKEYKEFISKLTDKKIFEKGPYQLFELEDRNYLPLFYIAKSVDFYNGLNTKNILDPSVYLELNNNEQNNLYVDMQKCPKDIFLECRNLLEYKNSPKISFRKINKTKYSISIDGARDPYVLVFLNAFHPSWKVFFSNTEIARNSHFVGNGYANAWYIAPHGVGGAKNYELIIEMTDQRTFYYSLLISILAFAILLYWGIKLFFPRRIIDIIKKFNV